MRKQTINQKWQWERCFTNYGKLKTVISLLENIAKSKSTIREERREIEETIRILDGTISLWKKENKASKKLYIERSKE